MASLWTRISASMGFPRLLWSVMLVLLLVTAYFLSTKVLYKDSSSQVRRDVHSKYNKMKRLQGTAQQMSKRPYGSRNEFGRSRIAVERNAMPRTGIRVSDLKRNRGVIPDSKTKETQLQSDRKNQVAPLGNAINSPNFNKDLNGRKTNKTANKRDSLDVGIGKHTFPKSSRKNNATRNMTEERSRKKLTDNMDNRNPDNGFTKFSNKNTTKKLEMEDRKPTSTREGFQRSDKEGRKTGDRKSRNGTNIRPSQKDTENDNRDRIGKEQRNREKAGYGIYGKESQREPEKGFGSKSQQSQRPSEMGFGSKSQQLQRPSETGFGSKSQRLQRPSESGFGSKSQQSLRPSDSGFGSKSQQSQKPSETGFGSKSQQSPRPSETGLGSKIQKLHGASEAGFGSKTQQLQRGPNVVYGSRLQDTRVKTADMVKWVHLDLKGAPPKVAYLQAIIPVWKSWGVNGVLIEYEDSFPYTEKFEILHTDKGYSPSQIRDILSILQNNNMEVVPLVQSLGHLEFVLKHPAFEKYREDPRYPAFLNPGMEESVKLITDLIDQIMKVHKNSRYLHIGADEVHVIGNSSASKNTIANAKLEDANGLYMHHVKSIAQYVKNKYPGVKVLIWEDMLRKIPLQAIEKSQLAKYVEPVVWNYAPNITEKLEINMWQKYSMLFQRVWVASAYKGASGPIQHLPDLNIHVKNHVSWIRVLKWLRQKHPHLKIGGFVLTGWSRFDHFSALCDLLPVSMPSLALCLQVLQDGSVTKSTFAKAASRLQCPSTSEPKTFIFQRTRFPAELSYRNIPADWKPKSNDICNFPGQDVFYTVLKYHALMNKFKLSFDPLTGRTRGHCNRFSIGHMYIDPYRVDLLCSKYANELLNSFVAMEDVIRISFFTVYGSDVTTEWLEENVINFETWLKAYDTKVKAAAGRNRVWGIRPDKHVDKLKEQNSGLAGLV